MSNQTITPGLIIYRSPRHSRSCQNNIKYGLFSRKVDFLTHLQKSQSTLPMKHYISNLTRHVSEKTFEEHTFLKLLTRIRNLCSLTLKLSSTDWRGESSFYSWGNKEPEIKFKKTIRKIFVLCSKAQRINISISNDSFRPPPFPFKSLVFAKLLKHFSCSLKTSLFKDYENLIDYITRARRRGLEHTNSFEFEIDKFYFYDGHRFDEAGDLKKAIEKINSLSQNPSIKFDIKIDEPIHSSKIRKFTPILENLQKLTELRIHPGLDNCLAERLKIIQDNKNLTKLNLQFSYPEYSYQSPDAVKDLSSFRLTARSLTTLEVYLKNFTKLQGLDSFMKEIKKCSQLSSLSLQFHGDASVNDSLLSSLMQALKKLPKLTDFTLHQWITPPSSAQEQTNFGMKDFFTDLKALKNLKGFDLKFYGSKIQFSHEEFMTLCKALRHLTQLQTLKLRLSNNSIENKGIAYFSTVILKFKQLRSFDIGLHTNLNRMISAKAMNQLTESLASLKYLSRLFWK